MALAQGVTLPAGIHQATLNKVLAFPPGAKTSMQTDAERGKPLELETFTGYVVRAGRRLGVPCRCTSRSTASSNPPDSQQIHKKAYNTLSQL